jgi:hypothetical protein
VIAHRVEDSQLRDTGRAYTMSAVAFPLEYQLILGLPDPSNLAQLDSFSRVVPVVGDMLCELKRSNRLFVY